MKHLKSFNQINESIFGDFISQSKPYWDLDDIEFDDIRGELDNIRGRHAVTDREKSKIERIINSYLHPEVTGMKINNVLVVAVPIGFKVGLHYRVDLSYNLPFFEVGTEISVYCYEDDYFVLNMNIPVSTPPSNKTQYIVMEEFFYVIDGWDGFEEWANKTSPYTQNQEMYKLLKSPLRDLRPTDYIKKFTNKPDDLYYKLMTNYPYIKGWGAKTFYFFDPSRGGEHFCTMEVRGTLSLGGTTKQREYYYDDGTLLDDGTRSR